MVKHSASKGRGLPFELSPESLASIAESSTVHGLVTLRTTLSMRFNALALPFLVTVVESATGLKTLLPVHTWTRLDKRHAPIVIHALLGFLLTIPDL